ncbi:4303_t:CDS:2, partial [Funneliformis caledonium]
TQKKAEECQDCLTTTIYGETYLVPEKVKAREESDWPRNGLIEQQMRKDFALCSRNLSINRKSNFSNFDDLDDFPKKEKKGNKNNKKLSKKLHILWAVQSNFKKIICQSRCRKDGVFLEVEEKVGDKLEYYEIMYQQYFFNRRKQP